MSVSPINNQPTNTAAPIANDKPLVNQQVVNKQAAAPVIDTAPPAVEDVKKAVDVLNRLANSANTNVNFEVDQQSGKVIVKVINAESKEIIRQIPSKEALELSHAIDAQQGLLFKTTA